MKTKRTVVHTFISHETKIKGELEFSGNVRIDSEIEGDLTGKSGLLILGEKAIIKGNIKSEAIVIMGQVEGCVEALDCVEVSPSGKVTGNIIAPNVNFEPGSAFVGRCIIGVKPDFDVKHIGKAETSQMAMAVIEEAKAIDAGEMKPASDEELASEAEAAGAVAAVEPVEPTADVTADDKDSAATDEDKPENGDKKGPKRFPWQTSS